MKKFSNFVTMTEGLALKGDYKGTIFQRLVAAFYVMAPVSDPEAVEGFKDLWNKINRQNKFLQSKFQFNPGQHDAYPSLKALRSDMDAQRASGVKRPVMNVYAEPPGPDGEPGQQGHPMLTNDQNVTLRGVHDAIAHLYGNHPFSARGEYGAYIRHLKTLCNPDQAKSGKCPAARVMFTEIVGQTSYYYVHGDFPPQKAAILRDFDHWNVGRLAPESKLNEFFTYSGKELVPSRQFDPQELAAVDPRLPEVLAHQNTSFQDRASARAESGKKPLKYGLQGVGQAATPGV